MPRRLKKKKTKPQPKTIAVTNIHAGSHCEAPKTYKLGRKQRHCYCANVSTISALRDICISNVSLETQFADMEIQRYNIITKSYQTQSQ